MSATIYVSPGSVVDSIVETLRPIVAEIEAGVETTRGHYARYMAIFSQFTDNAGQANVLALALIKAGANERGVNDALKLSF